MIDSAVMSTVAEQLHLAREAKSLTVHQVAEVTKIRTDHIRALEEGNFNAFSAPVYIRGFVRTYATLLKLDVPRLMTALDEELGHTDKFREPPPLTDQTRGTVDFITLQFSKVNWKIASIGIGVVAVLLLVLLIVSLSRRSPAADSLGDLPAPVYQSTSAGPTLPLPAPPARPK